MTHTWTSSREQVFYDVDIFNIIMYHTYMLQRPRILEQGSSITRSTVQVSETTQVPRMEHVPKTTYSDMYRRSAFNDLFVVSKAFFFRKRLRLDLVCKAWRTHIREMLHARRLVVHINRWKEDPFMFYRSILSEMEECANNSERMSLFQRTMCYFEYFLFYKDTTFESTVCINPVCVRKAHGNTGRSLNIPYCNKCALVYMCYKRGTSFRLSMTEGIFDPVERKTRTLSARSAYVLTKHWWLRDVYLMAGYLARVFQDLARGIQVFEDRVRKNNHVSHEKRERIDATIRMLTDAHGKTVDSLCDMLFGPFTK